MNSVLLLHVCIHHATHITYQCSENVLSRYCRKLCTKIEMVEMIKIIEMKKVAGAVKVQYMTVVLKF